MAESVANDRLTEAIRERDVTIEGTDLLSLVEQGAGVDSLLSRELSEEYATAIEAARDHLVDALAVEDVEALARRAFDDEPTYPVEHREDVVSRLREELTAARDRRAARRKEAVAGTLADLREPATELVEAAIELDAELAVARFARDFECTMPEFVDSEVDETGGGETEGGKTEGEIEEERGDESSDAEDSDVGGFAIEGGRSPLLDVPFEAVEPVDYRVDGVALLSGVNSGGKTSTLDLLGLVVTLAHMGLPVPAERARVARIDEFHYHAKSQGTLDAGAFESTLREFGDLVTSVSADLDVFVLVDELESITEPGASANIMAGILEALDERGATAVFVSHLARDILDAAEVDLAVDGIQAEGLVDGELVVDRSPVKGTLARSTPELIVEKLAGEAGGGEGESDEVGRDDGEVGGDVDGDLAFYRDLLNKFEE